MKAPTKEYTVSVCREAFTKNKTSAQLLAKLSKTDLQLAAAFNQELQEIYNSNRPALKKELKTKIAGILTRGSSNLFGKPALNKELLTAVEAAQKMMVTSKDVKDDKLKQTLSTPQNRSPRG